MTVRVSIIALLTTSILALACFGQNSPNLSGNPTAAAWGAAGTVWGGDHLELDVTADGANLDFDCASGTITQSLAVDAHGVFRARGTLARERPGPVMRDSPGPAQATYTGTIQGDTMHLVVSSGSPEPYGEYVLTRGKPGRVVKCK
ncbi:MAG: hypothetical protein WBS19_07845 [Candidatus Korobacteraceae bacterium]